MSYHAKLVNHLNELKSDKQAAQAAGQVALVNALSLCIEDTEKEIMAIFNTKQGNNTMKNYTIIDRVINILTFIAVIVIWLTL